MAAVRLARPADVADVVRIHQESFAGFFLTSLGPKFLSRFYRSMIQAGGCICLVAVEGKSLVGFAVGPIEPAGFFRGLFLRQGLGFALDAAAALLAHPAQVGPRLLRAIKYRGEPPLQLPGSALLSSIAVSRGSVGTGVAGQLLLEFCRQADCRGAKGVYLTTDRDDNAAVNRFYEKHGFVIESVLDRPDGRAMNRYVKSQGSVMSSAHVSRGKS